MRSCIYCLRPFDHTIGQGEHVLPDGFGRFQNQLVFRGMCPECNVNTKDCDEEVIRCSPAAVACFGAARSARSLKRREGGRTSLVAAHGVRPPQLQVWIDGKPKLGMPDPSVVNRLQLPDQMRVILADAESPPILLRPEITFKGMQAKLSKWQLSKIRRVDIHADQRAFDHYMSLLTQILPNHTTHKSLSLDVGVHSVRAEAMCMVTNRYFRAIAKIAFHYFLLTNQRGLSGAEPMFAPIRHYIRWGGLPNEFFTDHKIPAVFDWFKGDGLPSLPDELQHILVLDERQHEIHVFTWLGVGPAGDTPRHVVRIAKLPNTLIHPGGLRAHQYVYRDDAPPGYSGDFSEFARTTLTN